MLCYVIVTLHRVKWLKPVVNYRTNDRTQYCKNGYREKGKVIFAETYQYGS